jgi:hypothetical protein
VALYGLWLHCRIGALSLERIGFSSAEIDGLLRWRARLEPQLQRLIGRNLQCWCPLTSRYCHAEFLLEYARALQFRMTHKSPLAGQRPGPASHLPAAALTLTSNECCSGGPFLRSA